MPENNVADLIVSAVIAVAGGALSAYLAKKMIDAMDVSKKVCIAHNIHRIGRRCSKEAVLELAEEV